MKKLMKNLYVNIGDKVCKVAEFCGKLGCVAVIAGIVMLIGFLANTGEEFLLIGAIASVVLGIALVISSWPMYAFGQITNDVRAIKTNVCSQAVKTIVSDLPEL